MISDEAKFSTIDKGNTQNVRHAPKGDVPSFNNDQNESREKLTVWSDLCGKKCTYYLSFIY